MKPASTGWVLVKAALGTVVVAVLAAVVAHAIQRFLLGEANPVVTGGAAAGAAVALTAYHRSRRSRQLSADAQAAQQADAADAASRR